ncbi:MAG: anti-sigma factor [Planctomycetota bacterium]
MSSTTNNIPPRIEELMVDAATQGLSPQDAAELQTAITSDPSLREEAEAYELAATAVELSLTKQTLEDLPPALRDKLMAAAPKASAAIPALKLAGGAAETGNPKENASFSFSDGRMFGWYAAVAALVALAFVLFLEPTPQVVEKVVEVEVEVPVERLVEVPAPTPLESTLAEQYAALSEDDATVAANWGFAGGEANQDYANATGEVIWNGKTQTGYMKLTGMPVNKPTEIQYQLWIVDGSRDIDIENTNRIDGGVFDITAEGEVIVPINAKLIARDAAAFAITVETPGGVVESKGPLQILAVVDKG